MSQPMARRVVMDTNVLVSALLQPTGSCGELLRRWEACEFQLVMCPEQLAELAEVLARPKPRKRIVAQEAEALLSQLKASVELRADPLPAEGFARDPKDDYLVALARGTRADRVVSGDLDLVDMEHPDPPVCTPRAFRDLLATSSI